MGGSLTGNHDHRTSSETRRYAESDHEPTGMDETDSQSVNSYSNPAEVKAMNIKRRVSVNAVTLLIVVVGFVGPSAAQTEVKAQFFVYLRH